jgi:hypothetical protein
MSAALLRIEAFFEILSSRTVLIEIGVLAVCLLLGGLVGLELSRRYERHGNKAPMALSWRYFATQGNVVVTPVIVVLALVLVAISSLQAAHFDVTLLAAAERLPHHRMVGAQIAVYADAVHVGGGVDQPLG